MLRTIAGALALAVVSFAQGSPYPASKAPTTSLYVVAESGRGKEELLCLDSLAGHLARQMPRLYRVTSSSWATDTADAYSVWLQGLESSHGVTVDSSLISASLQTVIGQFKSEVSGYVRCDWADDSTSAALTFAAAGDGILVAASQSVADALSAAGISEVRDLRAKSVADVLPEALPHLSTRIFVFQDPSKSVFLGDYAIFARAPTMLFGSDSSTQNTLLNRASSPAAAFGWGPDEGSYVSTLTKHGIYVHASDFNKNLAALSNVKTSGHVERARAASSRVTPSDANMSNSAHTVAFVMTDGDNLQWTFSGWYTSSKWFGNSQRGSVPLGWTFSPATASLAPSILQKVMSDLTANDELVAGPSGIGYINPDLPFNGGLSEFGKLTSQGMSQSGMRTISVLQSQDSADLDHLAEVLTDKDAIFLGYFDGQDKISWIGKKPVIKDRYSLWGTGSDIGCFQCDVQPIIDKLKRLPKDSSSLDGYSVISVHAWTHGYDDVAKVVAGLKAAGGFDVVLPSELARRVSALGPSSSTTCHCDHVGKGSPDNGYSCTNGVSAYCASTEACGASGEWFFPPSDWDKICVPSTTCHCDHVGKGAPDNGYSCTNGVSAYCASTAACDASGEWSYPPSDWDKICLPKSEVPLALVV